MELTVYFNCHLGSHEKAACIFKIVIANDAPYPFHLYRLENAVANEWQRMSVYPNMSDAIGTLLYELYSVSIVKAIRHGNLILNTQTILTEIISGKMLISIVSLRHKKLHASGFDFVLEDLVDNYTPRI